MTTTNTIENIESDERCINSLVETETLTLNERINKNTVDLFNSLKHGGGKGRITGKTLLLNKITNLCVIDVDVNKSYNDELKKQVRKQILGRLSDDDVIIKTASDGLHIYCNTDLFVSTSNRMMLIMMLIMMNS